MTKIKWYKKWHDFRYAHHFHVFLLVIMCLSILSNLLPTSTSAALSTKTITKSSLSDFAEGSLNDLLNENDSLSMHLGKKVNTGNSSTSADLNSYSGRAITRTADGKIHIAWLKKESSPKQIYYTASIDEGSNWEIPTVVATDYNATGVLAKVDGNAQVHLFWAVANAGGNHIKHRIKGSDGSWGAIFTIPTNELDGAVADWQAIPQGDHYGNYYDTVTGQLATVTRTTPKTVYDATSGKIHDVPAGYLGVRPYSNSQVGGIGYEAVIEEARTNLFSESSFENDTNSDGLANSTARIYVDAGDLVTQSLSTTPAIHGSKSQYFKVTGGAAAQTQAGLMLSTSVVTPNTQYTFTGWAQLVQNTGCTGKWMIVETAAGSWVKATAISLTPGTSMQKSLQTFTTGSTTDAVNIRILANSDFHTNDILEFYADAVQIEAGAFATSYIPTTTVAVTRNADLVTIPTSAWSAASGTVFVAGARHDSANTNNDYFSIYNNANDRIFMRNGYGTSGFGFHSYDSTGNTAANSPSVSGQTLLAHVASGRWSATDTKAYFNGSPGASTGGVRAYTLLPTAQIGGTNSQTVYFSGGIHRFAVYNSALSDSDISNRNNFINGTEEAIVRNPIADWQAISQGDHYGNFQNSVSGGLATVTRNTTKTIYDPSTSKIYDVPANYLGVRPRSDEKPGLEAEIEESRTNYIRNSSFETDSDSNGLADTWMNWMNTLPTPTYSSDSTSIIGSKSQRVRLTGTGTSQAGDLLTMATPSSGNVVGSEAVIGSVYLKGSAVNCNVALRIYAQSDSAYIAGSSTINVTLTNTWQRFQVPYTLPSGTTFAYFNISANSVDTGDAIDFYADAAQLEKGPTASSYIPTTTAAVTRANDVATVPTAGLSAAFGTAIASAKIDRTTTVNRGVFSMEQGGVNERLSVYVPGNTTQVKPEVRGNTTGASAYPAGLNVSTSYPSVGLRWSGVNVQGISEGVLGTGTSMSAAFSTFASAMRIGSFTGGLYFNDPISRFTTYAAPLSDSNVAKVSTSIYSNGSTFDSPIPSVDSSSNIHLTYNKGGGAGIGYRMWNGSSWIAPNLAAVVTGVGDHSHQNTLSIGSNLYYFYTLDSDSKRYFVKRTSGTWSSPVVVSDFVSHDANEIVDSEGNIEIFSIDESLADTVLKNRKYIVSGNSFTAWSVLDSQSAKDVSNPSATITSNGNVWAYYNIGTDIYYKIYNKVTSNWGARTTYTLENPTTWKDLSGNGNDGTLQNIDYNTSSGWVGSGTDSDPYALKFNPNSPVDAVNFPQIQNTGNTLTYETWFKYDALRPSVNEYIFGSFVSTPSYIPYSVFRAGWSQGTWFSVRTDNGTFSTASFYLSNTNWHHLVGVYSGEKLQFWVDGVMRSEVVATGNLTPSTSPTAMAPQSTGFDGRISTARIYNKSLSSLEIIQNYNAGKSATTGYVSSNLVLDAVAAKANGGLNLSDGLSLKPKVRYQENFHYFSDKVDLLYRQNPTGDNSNHNLYYGTVGSDSTGTYVSPESGDKVLTTSWLGGWGDPALLSNVNIPGGTAINYELRTGNGADKNSVTWGNWVQTGRVDSTTGTGNRLYTIPAANMPDQAALPMGTNKYLQVRINLISENGTNVPTLFDYSLNYLADEAAPQWTYPTAVPAFTDANKTTPLTSGSFTGVNSGTSAYFDWSGATEPVGESGISNYYVYFGPDITANPLTAGTDKGTTTEGLLDIATPVSGTNYYLRVSVKDVAGNLLSMPSGASIFTYKFDNERPKPPTNYSVSPVGWSNANNFDFTWQAAIDPGSGSSNIKEYQYKRAGGGDDWTMIPASASITIPDITSYKDGMNDFYIRSVDTAGNHSGDTVADWTVIHYYYNGTAPSKPQNVTVDPQQSNTNSFTFSWSEPANHNAPIKGYYYSINEAPTLTNSVFTTATTTGAIPAAVKQGPNNKFYVVAVDTANDSLFGEVSDELVFECNTVAPGIPGGVVISDSSNLQDNNWILTVAWNRPAGLVSGYRVYRSTDGVNFVNVGMTDKDNLVFSNSGLSNTSTYSYKVMAIDSAGAESGYSSTVMLQPTGKFVQPPILVSGPDVKATATSAVVTWTTDRISSSFVAASKTTDYQGASGQLDAVTSHKVILTGLEPGATYNYKVQSFDENRNYATDEAYSIPYSLTTQSAPGISEVEISDIRLNAAIVSWKTTTVATSTILYGKSNTYGEIIEDQSGSSVTTHTVKLEKLDHTSTYHFRIKGTDTDGNQLVSDDYSFETLTYPKISDVKFEQQKNASTSTILVVWNSNVPTTSILEYAEGNAIYKEVSKSTLETKHSMLVSGLRDNTPYRMVVKGRDAYGTEAVSDVNTVKTDFDTRPPAIFNVMTESSIVGFGADAKTQVIVSWESDEPSSSQVEYDVGTFGDGYTLKTQEDGGLTTSHVVIISGLKPSTSYHFRAVSRDGSGNTGQSEDGTILTEQASSSIIDIIVNSLQNSLGWIFGSFKRS